MRFIQARDFYRGRRNRIVRIHLHSVEGIEADGTAENVARYFQKPARRSSAHYVVDNNSEVQCVRDEDTAFHVGNDNSKSIGIEHAGFARQSREEWLDDYGKDMLERSARLCANLCRKWRIPIKWLDIVDLKENQSGISSHANAAIAFGGSTHTDPGRHFPHDYYIKRVKFYFNGEEEDWLTSDEAEARLANIELRLVDLQNGLFKDGDNRISDKIIKPARDSLAALMRRIAGVFGILDEGGKSTYDASLDKTK